MRMNKLGATGTGGTSFSFTSGLTLIGGSTYGVLYLGSSTAGPVLSDDAADFAYSGNRLWVQNVNGEAFRVAGKTTGGTGTVGIFTFANQTNSAVGKFNGWSGSPDVGIIDVAGYYKAGAPYVKYCGEFQFNDGRGELGTSDIRAMTFRGQYTSGIGGEFTFVMRKPGAGGDYAVPLYINGSGGTGQVIINSSAPLPGYQGGCLGSFFTNILNVSTTLTMNNISCIDGTRIGSFTSLNVASGINSLSGLITMISGTIATFGTLNSNIANIGSTLSNNFIGSSFKNPAGSIIIDDMGFYHPIDSSNASAPNNSVYRSTDSNTLVWKDPAGNVYDLNI